MTAAQRRRDLLDRAAFDAARSWARAFFAELAGEGRRVEGGWPGTMNEARTRAEAQARGALQAKAMTALTHDERGRIARLTYDEARRSWGAMAKAAPRMAPT